MLGVVTVGLRPAGDKSPEVCDSVCAWSQFVGKADPRSSAPPVNQTQFLAGSKGYFKLITVGKKEEKSLYWRHQPLIGVLRVECDFICIFDG